MFEILFKDHYDFRRLLTDYGLSYKGNLEEYISIRIYKILLFWPEIRGCPMFDPDYLREAVPWIVWWLMFGITMYHASRRIRRPRCPECGSITVYDWFLDKDVCFNHMKVVNENKKEIIDTAIRNSITDNINMDRLVTEIDTHYNHLHVEWIAKNVTDVKE